MCNGIFASFLKTEKSLVSDWEIGLDLDSKAPSTHIQIKYAQVLDLVQLGFGSSFKYVF